MTDFEFRDRIIRLMVLMLGNIPDGDYRDLMILEVKELTDRHEQDKRDIEANRNG